MSAALERVQARYDTMAARVAFVRDAPPADAALSAAVGPFLAAEARLLDGRAFEKWQGLLSQDMQFWVPIHPEDHPGRDQALLYDDRRRIGERVMHFSDRQAWAVVAPEPLTIRQIAMPEAWDTGAEILATAAITLLQVRRGDPVKLSGREILSLQRHATGFTITSKTLLLPELVQATPHLGWIL